MITILFIIGVVLVVRLVTLPFRIARRARRGFGYGYGGYGYRRHRHHHFGGGLLSLLGLFALDQFFNNRRP